MVHRVSPFSSVLLEEKDVIVWLSNQNFNLIVKKRIYTNILSFSRFSVFSGILQIYLKTQASKEKFIKTRENRESRKNREWLYWVNERGRSQFLWTSDAPEARNPWSFFVFSLRIKRKRRLLLTYFICYILYLIFYILFYKSFLYSFLKEKHCRPNWSISHAVQKYFNVTRSFFTFSFNKIK